MGAVESTPAPAVAPTVKTLTVAPAPYSFEVADSRTDKRGPARETHVQSTYDPASTLYTNLLARKKIDPEGVLPLFGSRKIDPKTGDADAYEWINLKDFLADVDACASGMKNSLNTERGSLIGLFSKNRYEWCLVEHSANRMAYTLVPLYDTLGPKAVPFIMNHTEMKVVFCAKEQFKTLMDCIGECPTVKTIVQFEDDVDSDETELAAKHNVQLLTLGQLMKAGKENIVPADPPKPEDISTICYTSGTTGDPKGVVLTHANFAAEACACDFVTDIFPSDVYIAYLPLAHVYERAIHAKVIKDGGSIGFYQGDVAKLVDDLQELHPTIFVTVPRLLNRIYDKVTHGVARASAVKKYLFERAYSSKERHLNEGGWLTHGLWDPVVFGKLQALMGGRVRLIINGSAPITKEVKQFYQIVFGCTVLEGYGLTETCAAFTCSTVNMPVGNHVGVPLPGLQARLEDVPEMNYTSNDEPRPRGEILLKGPTVFQGYYKQPELTAQVKDADGWFHTGDIGCWNEDGTLSIIDRKKNIFKLSQGEYVAPEKIEAIYCKSRFVAQAFVYGDSHQNYLVGVIVPNEGAIEHWLEDQPASGKSSASSSSGSTSGMTLEQMCADPEVKRAVAADLEEIGKQFKLFRFERVQKIHLTPEAFALENDLLTPTFKLKRPQLKQHFAKELADMYASP